MIFWIIILVGIVILSMSLSNPVYKLSIKKYLKFNVFFEVLVRSFFFILSIFIIFIGLYLESKI
jgi:hypothetical protein